ncbi:MAG: phosphotransferase [Planctomycetota bacterium]|nr:MAG: phosphotransferase [Planctomycetota bacterium]
MEQRFMPRGGAHFSSEELAQVLSHYSVGVIHHVKHLTAGSKRAPKMVIISEQGKFLLKRRPKGKDDLYRVNFAHAVQTHLASKDFPVTNLVATRDQNDTVLQLNHHIYELFQFVTGYRYDGSAEATIDTGRQLARFHQHLTDFANQSNLPKGSFHDSNIVRRHLRTTGTQKGVTPAKKLQQTAEALMVLYNASSVRVSELGFDSWPQQIVHGDWHPGNMLFNEGKLTAVLDFDSVKVAARVTDLANGMLQFSIVGDRPNPADWPDYLDQAKLVQFLDGYRQVIDLQGDRFDSLFDLMIETMIAEAILPVAATGFFGHLSGLEFLRMIQRKAEWIDTSRDKLAQAIRHQ